ncbi:hypothetical protein BDV93DRAFT_611976 [Ceratobasidium sp. AG-I]|nr:hypothetical protein BDV93DRAFT_611976 [Ceratobasidium sp. AG-I]
MSFRFQFETPSQNSHSITGSSLAPPFLQSLTSNLTDLKPIFCPHITHGPSNSPDPAPAYSTKPNPIVFPPSDVPAQQRGDSTDTCDSSKSNRSRKASKSARSHNTTFTGNSYRPNQLCKKMLLSENASDHLRRVHVTNCRYFERQDNGHQFVMFSVLDSAFPNVSNFLILDRNGRHTSTSVDSGAWHHAARAWVSKLLPIDFVRSCVGHPSLRPGRFYVSEVTREDEFLAQIGFGQCNLQDTLILPTDQAFSLEQLLVLASSLASPLRFRHPNAMRSPDWYPQSMWEAMRLVSDYIQKEEPLPTPLQLRNPMTEPRLLEKVLTKYGDNLRKYHNQVIRRQQKEDSNPEIAKNRQAEMDRESARHEQAIQAQKEESFRLSKERELLAQEQQKLREEIEELRRIKLDATTSNT